MCGHSDCEKFCEKNLLCDRNAQGLRDRHENAGFSGFLRFFARFARNERGTTSTVVFVVSKSNRGCQLVSVHTLFIILVVYLLFLMPCLPTRNLKGWKFIISYFRSFMGILSKCTKNTLSFCLVFDLLSKESVAFGRKGMCGLNNYYFLL